MRSTFSGLETARRGMVAQQTALQTTAHNISNANTPGYSRQRVNFETTTPYPPASLNRPLLPGQMGTGVEEGSIQRIRDQFLDTQYRHENSNSGYWSSKSEHLSRAEEVLNEPSDKGLSKTMNQLWSSLQDLAIRPDDESLKAVVRERGIAVAETFQYLNKSTSNIRDGITEEINTAADKVNMLTNEINNLNKQIADVEPHGYVPNDLYDERDQLIDQLSNVVNIKVTNVDVPNSSAIAEGKVKIEIVNEDGSAVSTPPLIDPTSNTVTPINYDVANGTVSGLSNVKGELKGLIDSYTQLNTTISELDQIAANFATAFNDAHGGIDFFTATGSGDIAVAQPIKDDLANIDGDSASTMATAINKTYNGFNFENRYTKLISDLAVKTQEANRFQDNAETMKGTVDTHRQSISGVSLDEEMTNMIKFQHAYNASARALTTIDEMLDRVINNLGLVGR